MLKHTSASLLIDLCVCIRRYCPSFRLNHYQLETVSKKKKEGEHLKKHTCEFWQTTLDWDSVSAEGLFGIAQISQRALGS